MKIIILQEAPEEYELRKKVKEDITRYLWAHQYKAKVEDRWKPQNG